MNISPDEAEEALAATRKMIQKTRQSMASAGTYITLIVTGIIWLVGFMCTQFLTGAVVGYIWTGLSVTGAVAGTILGFRMGQRVRSPATGVVAKRLLLYWLFLALFCLAVIAVAWPLDGKQATLLIVLFILVGQLSTGLMFPFAADWWPLPIAALALIGYFLLPGYFYLWMSLLGGGGMIAFGLYIHSRW